MKSFGGSVGWQAECFPLKLILKQTMTNAKRILITTESREIFIVHGSERQTINGFCEICRAETRMLTLDETVSFTGKSMREMIPEIQTGAVHSIETASGHLLVCQNSLREFCK